MPLFNRQGAGFRPGTVIVNLIELAQSADGTLPTLGQSATAPPASPTLRQITYTPPAAPDVVQTRINNIANSGQPGVPATFTNRIIVAGVPSSATLPDGTPITSVGGAAFPPDANGDLRIFYDVGQCNGIAWCAFDAAGNSIFIPTNVILYHELSHSFHRANGTFNAADPELQAITDENDARAKGAFPNRNPANHGGGCGAGCTRTGKSCFIASAAFGSSLAPQVQELRRIRDVFLRRSALGHEFFARLFAEYYRFSPGVAADMEASPALKISIRTLVVKPLLDLLSLIEGYVRGGWQQEDFEDQAEDILVRFREGLPDAGYNQDQVELIYLALADLKARLDSNSGAAGKQELTPMRSAGSGPVGVLNYLARVVLAGASDTRHLSWAVMSPLTIYWAALTKLKSLSAQRSNPGSYLTEAIDDWLVTAPIPPIFEQLREDAVREDLSQLAETVFAIPRVRQRFGTRLLDIYGNRVPYDLEAVLQATGYSPVESDD